MGLLRRFCLYGFLKNQQYYEPFLILFLLRHGLSFADIGLLVSFREICMALMEIPSGAAADVFGRKKSMLFSLSAYIGSFLVFSFSSSLSQFATAMFLFSIGEAFRTGTHKSIIFAWLKKEGREDERTSVYGRTRSWSKFGSALSLPAAVALVFVTGDYSILFLASSVPYLLNIANISSYPSWLDSASLASRDTANNEETPTKGHWKHLKPWFVIWKTLRESLEDAFRTSSLRRILLESMCYEGIFKTAKDYVQPILMAMALSIPMFPDLKETRKVAIATGSVYFILHLLSGLTAAKAGAFRKLTGGDEKASSSLWLAELLVFTAMGAGMIFGSVWIVVSAFVMLAILQNLWRPVLVGRCAEHSNAKRMATLLSVESQSKSLFICVFAPLLGWSVDAMEKIGANGLSGFLPVSVLGMLVSLIAIASRWKMKIPTLNKTEIQTGPKI